MVTPIDETIPMEKPRILIFCNFDKPTNSIINLTWWYRMKAIIICKKAPKAKICAKIQLSGGSVPVSLNLINKFFQTLFENFN